MTALDQVKKYREFAASMTDFAIITLASIVAALSLNIFTRLLILFIGNNDVLGEVSFFVLFIFPVGIIAGVFWVERRVKSVIVGQWKTTLCEGAPGAIKLLQNIQWEKIFRDLRYAKLGFFLYGIFNILGYWTLASVSFFVFKGILENIIHMSINDITVVLFSLVIALLLNTNYLRNRYEQMGRLDWLLWELRWFESEFRGADFEA